MKIIDFEKFGNVVRFYLGDNDEEKYWGDDWDDAPYEHNAGLVYDEYIKGHRDIYFPPEYIVVEPSDGRVNSIWSKEDMKNRDVPCICVKKTDNIWLETESFDVIVASDNATKYYFGDRMEIGEEKYEG